MFLKAVFWQNATMACILLSFLSANLGWEPAAAMWRDTPDGIAILLAGGVGLKMAKDVGMRMRNGKGSQDVDTGA